jgi:hypothetical protein
MLVKENVSNFKVPDVRQFMEDQYDRDKLC